MNNVKEHYKVMGELIRIRRKKMTLTQTDLGDMIGVTKSMISKWERGLHIQNASLSKVSKLCSILDIDSNLVLFDSEKISIDDYRMYIQLYLKNI